MGPLDANGEGQTTEKAIAQLKAENARLSAVANARHEEVLALRAVLREHSHCLQLHTQRNQPCWAAVLSFLNHDESQNREIENRRKVGNDFSSYQSENMAISSQTHKSQRNPFAVMNSLPLQSADSFPIPPHGWQPRRTSGLNLQPPQRSVPHRIPGRSVEQSAAIATQHNPSLLAIRPMLRLPQLPPPLHRVQGPHSSILASLFDNNPGSIPRQMQPILQPTQAIPVSQTQQQLPQQQIQIPHTQQTVPVSHTHQQKPVSHLPQQMPISHTQQQLPVSHPLQQMRVSHTHQQIQVSHLSQQMQISHTLQQMPISHTQEQKPVSHLLPQQIPITYSPQQRIPNSQPQYMVVQQPRHQMPVPYPPQELPVSYSLAPQMQASHAHERLPNLHSLQQIPVSHPPQLISGSVLLPALNPLQRISENSTSSIKEPLYKQPQEQQRTPNQTEQENSYLNNVLRELGVSPLGHAKPDSTPVTVSIKSETIDILDSSCHESNSNVKSSYNRNDLTSKNISSTMVLSDVTKEDEKYGERLVAYQVNNNNMLENGSSSSSTIIKSEIEQDTIQSQSESESGPNANCPKRNDVSTKKDQIIHETQRRTNGGNCTNQTYSNTHDLDNNNVKSHLVKCKSKQDVLPTDPKLNRLAVVVLTDTPIREWRSKKRHIRHLTDPELTYPQLIDPKLTDPKLKRRARVVITDIMKGSSSVKEMVSKVNYEQEKDIGMGEGKRRKTMFKEPLGKTINTTVPGIADRVKSRLRDDIKTRHRVRKPKEQSKRRDNKFEKTTATNSAMNDNSDDSSSDETSGKTCYSHATEPKPRSDDPTDERNEMREQRGSQTQQHDTTTREDKKETEVSNVATVMAHDPCSRATSNTNPVEDQHTGVKEERMRNSLTESIIDVSSVVSKESIGSDSQGSQKAVSLNNEEEELVCQEQRDEKSSNATSPMEDSFDIKTVQQSHLNVFSSYSAGSCLIDSTKSSPQAGRNMDSEFTESGIHSEVREESMRENQPIKLVTLGDKVGDNGGSDANSISQSSPFMAANTNKGVCHDTEGSEMTTERSRNAVADTADDPVSSLINVLQPLQFASNTGIKSYGQEEKPTEMVQETICNTIENALLLIDTFIVNDKDQCSGLGEDQTGEAIAPSVISSGSLNIDADKTLSDRTDMSTCPGQAINMRSRMDNEKVEYSEGREESSMSVVSTSNVVFCDNINKALPSASVMVNEALEKDEEEHPEVGEERIGITSVVSTPYVVFDDTIKQTLPSANAMVSEAREKLEEEHSKVGEERIGITSVVSTPKVSFDGFLDNTLPCPANAMRADACDIDITNVNNKQGENTDMRKERRSKTMATFAINASFSDALQKEEEKHSERREESVSKSSAVSTPEVVLDDIIEETLPSSANSVIAVACDVNITGVSNEQEDISAMRRERRSKSRAKSAINASFSDALDAMDTGSSDSEYEAKSDSNSDSNDGVMNTGLTNYPPNNAPIYTPPNNAPIYTPPNNAPIYTPPNNAPIYTPPNNAPIYTPPNNAPIYTPPNNASIYTPPNSAPIYTPPNNAPIYTPPNNAPIYTPPNNAPIYAPPNIAPIYTLPNNAPIYSEPNIRMVPVSNAEATIRGHLILDKFCRNFDASLDDRVKVNTSVSRTDILNTNPNTYKHSKPEFTLASSSNAVIQAEDDMRVKPIMDSYKPFVTEPSLESSKRALIHSYSYMSKTTPMATNNESTVKGHLNPCKVNANFAKYHSASGIIAPESNVGVFQTIQGSFTVANTQSNSVSNTENTTKPDTMKTNYSQSKSVLNTENTAKSETNKTTKSNRVNTSNQISKPTVDNEQNKILYANLISRPLQSDVASDFNLRNPLQCVYCKAILNSTGSFEDHFISVHSFMKHRDTLTRYCDICDKTFTLASDYVRHTFNVHTLLKCNICSLFLSRDNIYEHFLSHQTKLNVERQSFEHGLKTHCSGWKCGFCGAIGDEHYTYDALLEHFRTVHNTQDDACITTAFEYVPCGVCGEVFTSEYQYLLHKYKHHFDKVSTFDTKWKCYFCQTLCQDHEGLLKHVLRVHMSGRLHCDTCLASFDSKEEWQRHQVTHKRPELKRAAIKPSIPDKEPNGALHKEKRNGRSVDTTTSTPKPYDPLECIYCEEKLESQDDFKMHFKSVHSFMKYSDEAMLYCEFCNKVFASAVDFVRHKLDVHCVLKCSRCGSHRTKDTIFNHWISHHRSQCSHEPVIKAHSIGVICGFCDSVLETSGAHNESFLDHMKTKHNILNEKSVTTPFGLFPCGLCSAILTSMSHHVEHRATCHKDISSATQPIKCYKCPKVFRKTNQNSLIDHVVKVHISGRIQCERCHNEFDSLAKLHKHDHKSACRKRKHTEIDHEMTDDSSKTAKINHEIMGDNEKTAQIDDEIMGNSTNTAKGDSEITDDNTKTKQLDQDMTDSAHNQATVNSLQSGRSGHYAKSRWPCRFCPDTSFQSKGDFLQHLRERHQLCDDTQGKLENAPEIIQSRLESVFKQFMCASCGGWFNSKISLAGHISSKHKVRPQKTEASCDICQKTFADIQYMRKHKRVVHEKCFECDECGVKFGLLNLLRAHKQKHQARSFQCEHCSYTFHEAHTLNRHLKNTHGTSEHKCSLCDKVFRCAFYLQRHVARHDTEKLYQCSQCAKRFGTKACLNTHKFTHTEEKTHVCQTCGKLFKTKTSLRFHERVTHIMQRRLACDVCSETFKLKHHLKTHMLKHTGARAFKCHVCEKSFGRKQILDTHMLSHTGEKAFHCELCGRDFWRKTNLNKHRKKEHLNTQE